MKKLLIKFFDQHWDLLLVIAWFVIIFMIASLTSCSSDNTKLTETHIKYKIVSVKRVDNPGHAVWPIDPRYEVVLENGDTIHTVNRSVLNMDSMEYIYLSKSVKHDTVYK